MANEKEINKLKELVRALSAETGIEVTEETIKNGVRFLGDNRQPLVFDLGTSLSSNKVERDITAFFKINWTDPESWPSFYAEWYGERHPASRPKPKPGKPFSEPRSVSDRLMHALTGRLEAASGKPASQPASTDQRLTLGDQIVARAMALAPRESDRRPEQTHMVAPELKAAWDIMMIYSRLSDHHKNDLWHMRDAPQDPFSTEVLSARNAIISRAKRVGIQLPFNNLMGALESYRDASPETRERMRLKLLEQPVADGVIALTNRMPRRDIANERDRMRLAVAKGLGLNAGS